MSIASEKIDTIIKGGLHPVLKREGFYKSSRTYRRAGADCIQIVNIQGNRYNTNDQGSLTINLAVYFPEAARIHGSFRITDHPAESDCMIRQRIGNLMPVQRDYWWKFDSKTDLDQMAKEVVSAWSDYGKAWLEDHSTVEGALQFVLSKKSPFFASIFYLMLQQQEKAVQYLIEAIEKAANNPLLKAHLEDWGHSRGLIP